MISYLDNAGFQGRFIIRYLCNFLIINYLDIRFKVILHVGLKLGANIFLIANLINLAAL